MIRYLLYICFCISIICSNQLIAQSITVSNPSNTRVTFKGASIYVDPSIVIDTDGAAVSQALVRISPDSYTNGEDTLSIDTTVASDAGFQTSGWNALTGTYTIQKQTGTGTAAEFQNMIRHIKYQSSNTNQNTVTKNVIIYIVESGVGVYLNPEFDEHHFYTLVSGGFTNNSAISHAAGIQEDYYGKAPYVATIVNASENAVVLSVTGGASSWLGGADEYVVGNTDEDKWRWINGPENGRQFWQGETVGQGGGTTAPDNYAGFPAGQPDDAGNNEDFLHMSNALGDWNDLPGTSVLTYYVAEYGSSTGDINASVNIVILSQNAIFQGNPF